MEDESSQSNVAFYWTQVQHNFLIWSMWTPRHDTHMVITWFCILATGALFTSPLMQCWSQDPKLHLFFLKFNPFNNKNVILSENEKALSRVRISATRLKLPLKNFNQILRLHCYENSGWTIIWLNTIMHNDYNVTIWLIIFKKTFQN